MRIVKRILTALLAVLLLSVHAAAAAANTVFTPGEGLRVLPVTSSVASMAGDTGVLFDGSMATGMNVDVSGVASKTFTVYMSTGIAKPLAAFAFKLAAPKGTRVIVRVAGSNDSRLIEWSPLPLVQTIGAKDGYKVVTVDMENMTFLPAFSFFRVDITVEGSDAFTLGEIVLLRPVSDEPEKAYASVDTVEEGAHPPIVEVPADAAPIDDSGVTETVTQSRGPIGWLWN